MEKSPDAFRTISEVAEWLDIPTHVLRFWESRFAQIKPVKRAGGRRYYRPSDMRLIGGVKALLHDQGMTIRGVQKLLREHGVKHVSSFSQSLDTDLQDTSDDTVVEHAATPTSPALSVRQTYKEEPETEAESEPADDEEDVEQLDIFSGAQQQDADEEFHANLRAVAQQPAPEAAPTQPTAIEPPAPSPPQIPATPNVPETDPGDDDPAS